MTRATRVLGTLALLTACAAVAAGVVPFLPSTDVRAVKLALLGAVAVFAVAWMIASCTRPVDLVKQRPSRLLAFLLGLLLPAASAAALVQAVGPDGAEGRWAAQVQGAGGGVYELAIESPAGEPRATGVNINDVDQYATDVAVRVPYADETRTEIVRGAKTVGKPSEGDTILVRFAPSRPDLGVRPVEGFWGGGFALLWIWGVALFVCAWTVFLFLEARDDVADLRRFSPGVHIPAALILAAGVCLLLPGAFYLVPTWAGWLLSLTAATTPWLALTWVVKNSWRL